MPTSEGTVAVFAARDVGRAEIQRVLGSLGADATVAVLSGKSRMGDRVVEQACIERGLAVECFRPSRNAVHPADEMIRRATRVLIVTGNGRNLDVGRVLRLAGRYAKPVQVIDAPPTTS